VRSSALKAGGVKRQREPSRQTVAVRKPAVDWLTLPSISKGAGANFSGDQINERLVRLAQSMLCAGLLEDEVCDTPISDLVMQGLERWFESIWGTNKYIDFSVHVHESFPELVGCDSFKNAIAVRDAEREAVTEVCGLDPSIDHFALQFQSNGRHDVQIKDGVMRLEAEMVGLGFEVAKTVETIGMSFGLLGSSWLEMCCSQLHWGGGESETDWATEWDEEISEFHGMTRAEFDEAVPPNLLDRQSLSDDSLIEIGNTGSAQAREVARQLLVLRRMGDKARGFRLHELSGFYEWNESLDSCVLLAWGDLEAVYRLADDYTQNYWNGDGNEQPGTGITLMPMDDPQWFAKQEAIWIEKAKVARIIDTLIRTLVGDDK
jgi:PRTRC genetic system protein F